jgi:hypothetical protein
MGEIGRARRLLPAQDLNDFEQTVSTAHAVSMAPSRLQTLVGMSRSQVSAAANPI